MRGAIEKVARYVPDVDKPCLAIVGSLPEHVCFLGASHTIFWSDQYNWRRARPFLLALFGVLLGEGQLVTGVQGTAFANSAHTRSTTD